MTALFLVFAVAMVVTAGVTPLIRRLAHRHGTLDHPGERKLHHAPTPRLGGVGLVAGWSTAIAALALGGDEVARGWLQQLPLLPIVTGAAIVFAIGVRDDLRPLGAGPKLMGQVVGAAVVAGAGVLIERVTFAGTTYPLGWLSVAATLGWLVGLTNAFNLLDGLDGLAAGLAIIAGGTCATIVIVRGDYATAVLLVALLGALVGFLPFNFKPASIFLGDGGSLFIGFVLAVTAVTGFQKGATALAAGVPLLIFALPLFDGASTIVRRLARAASMTAPRGWQVLRHLAQPDRGHIHHVLMTFGLSERAAVLLLYALAFSLSGVALLTMERQ